MGATGDERTKGSTRADLLFGAGDSVRNTLFPFGLGGVELRISISESLCSNHERFRLTPDVGVDSDLAAALVLALMLGDRLAGDEGGAAGFRPARGKGLGRSGDKTRGEELRVGAALEAENKASPAASAGLLRLLVLNDRPRGGAALVVDLVFLTLLGDGSSWS